MTTLTTPPEHRFRALAVPLAAVLTCLLPAAHSFRQTKSPGVSAAESTGELLASLPQQQRATTTFAADDESRTGWHFIPKDSRDGLPLRDMTPAQRDATNAALRAILSRSGLEKVKTVSVLEAIVRDLEGEDRRWSRDPDQYYVKIYGTPGESGRWAFSYEGHHVSLNFLFEDGEIVSSTPQFLGAHPARITAADAPQQIALLGTEAELAFDLAESLTDTQRAAAKSSDEAPAEIRNSGEPQPTAYEDVKGLAARDMSATQRRLLTALISEYCEVANEATAARRLLDVQGLDDVTFSYAGVMEWGQPHGYIIKGSTFVIDFVNSQPDAQGNPANHAHAIYRDLRGDFGVRLSGE